MEGGDGFRGFPENDADRKSLEDKRARMKRFSNPRTDGETTPTTSPHKPIFNRFLKQTPVKQSSASVTTTRPEVKEEVQIKFFMLREASVPAHAPSSTPADKPVVKQEKTEESPAKRIRKPSYKVLDNASEKPRSRKSSGEDSKPVISTSLPKVTGKSVVATQLKSKDVPSKPAQVPIREVTQIIETKIAAAIKEGPQVPLLGSKVAEKPVPVKLPAPAKRTASTSSELSFLSGQSVRSKRTPIPNKRFMSADSPPHKPQEVEPTPSTIAKSRKSVPTVSTSKGIAVTSKKRSASGDDVKLSIKKKYNKAPNGNGLVPLISDASEDVDQAARPRRVIIPNRKFIDEDEPVIKTEPPTKKSLEDKPKRRKSEKSSVQESVNGNGIPKQLPVENTSLTITAPVQQNGSRLPPPLAVRTVKEKLVQENGKRLSEPLPQVVKMEKLKEQSQPIIKQPNANDEITLLDDEANLYRSNPLFRGACILKESDQNDGHDGGIIFCGICSRVKHYRIIADKRKQGSFMCSECADLANTVFQIALKAQPFKAIPGPPVCEGSCPLNFQPPEQFCQACFAKSCLKNLPIKDDVYFKVWRSIPPMSRGVISCTPQPNPSSPNIGKVVYVNSSGHIVSTAPSLKLKMRCLDGTLDVVSCLDDSEDNAKSLNGDMNSARLLKVHPRSGTSCENTSPESQLVTQTQLQELKSNGVKEEIVLTRQIDEKRAAGPLIDTVYKSDLDHIDIFGFPVVVSGPSLPRKPLCFLCGSAGIEQLVFCSCCCEPYHPYCADDDLLLNTYADYMKVKPVDGCNGRPPGDLPESDVVNNKVTTNLPRSTDMRLFEWTCKRCLPCKSCGDCFGKEEMIRCNRCQNPYHVKSCIDKDIINKVKDPRKLKKVWICDDCMKCKSCGKRIENNRRVKTIQEVVENESDPIENDGKDPNGNYLGGLMLCKECFKQRMKGSYCPICEVCYDDNDWDSKMMECCKCNRWVHATCEKLNEDEYQILGKLPDYIEYICKLCHASPTQPVWLDAIRCLLMKELNTVVRKFEQNALGPTIRKNRSSLDMKPSYVCNLFGRDEENETREVLVDDNQEVEVDFKETPVSAVPKDKKLVRRNEEPRLVPGEEIMSCVVMLRNFVETPQTNLEKRIALEIAAVKNSDDAHLVYPVVFEALSKTAIHETPKREVASARKCVDSVATKMKKVVGNVYSIAEFYEMFLRTIQNLHGESEDEEATIISYAKHAIQDVFPWFVPSNGELKIHGRMEYSLDKGLGSEDLSATCFGTTSNAFQEVYWENTSFIDDRMCSLCGEIGDFPPELSGRLLWCGLNEWIHVNCAIWSSIVWEDQDGALQDVGRALHSAKLQKCKVCCKRGATVSCCHSACRNHYHFQCAVDANCFMYIDSTTFCSHHGRTKGELTEMDNMKVARRVFVDLEWIQKRGLKASPVDIKVLIGSMRVESLGEIAPISVILKPGHEPTSTLLHPHKFSVQRIFWDYDYPSATKECYKFNSIIDSAGFEQSIDPGVNIVIDHSKRESVINKGIECVRKFHKWAADAPRYRDEELIEWLPPCQIDDFEYTDEEEVDVGKRRLSSPQAKQRLQLRSDKKRCRYSLRSGRGDNDSESGITEGYASSVDSPAMTLVDTPTSSKALKRRRSLSKNQRKRMRKTFRDVHESPRRRSLRNYRLHDTSKEITQGWEMSTRCQPKDDNDSDNDSGVTEGTSSSAEFLESRKCQTNLLNRFNDTCEELENQEELVSVSNPPDSVTSSSPQELITPFRNVSDDCKGQVYTASLKFQVLKGSTLISDSYEAQQAWMSLFDGVNRARMAVNMKPLIHPCLDETLSGDVNDSANGLRVLGIYHRSVQYLLEQLPSVLTVVDQHKFQYSHRPYVDMENDKMIRSVNSKGSARCEGYQGRKPFDMFGWLASRYRKVDLSCNIREESSKCQGLPLAMQFRDLKEKARRRFVVYHSEIHGRGLFSRCDVEKGEMIIEYAGEVISPVLSDHREKLYDSKGIGCYMFRIKTKVIDATMRGNMARFINHSCEPNCEARTVSILGKDHIIIFALRKIFKGEELTYDYKFDREENKIPCSCGAARCRKYMN